jgi:hypothetical protein
MRVDEMKNRTAAKLLAGILMMGTVAVGGVAPAQAKGTDSNDTTTVVSAPVSRPMMRDTGWGGT